MDEDPIYTHLFFNRSLLSEEYIISLDSSDLGGLSKINNIPNLFKEKKYDITFVLKRDFPIFAAPSKTSIYTCTPIKGCTSSLATNAVRSK